MGVNNLDNKIFPCYKNSMRIALVIFLVFITGCSGKQIRQECMGLSVEDVKTSAHNYTKEINLGAYTAFEKTKDIIKGLGGSIKRADDLKLFIIAENLDKAFVNSIDTTQVGIVITPVSDNKSQLTLYSGNYYLGNFVFTKLALTLE